MTARYAVLALVALQRIAELGYAHRNTRALFSRGAIEVAPEQHRLFVALHAIWLAAMALVPSRVVLWPLIGVYAVLQCGRLWAIASLGPYWTTRVLTLHDAPLVRRGPYRFVKHPNYIVVALEIAILPLALGEVWVALTFSVLNALLLRVRIRSENAALEERRVRDEGNDAQIAR